MRVRTHSYMLQWLKYFLVGIEQTASLAVHTLSEILKLKARLEKELQQSFGRRNASAQLLLNSLFEQPATSVEDASRICDLSYKAANDLIGVMSKHEILHEVTGQTRNRVFVFAPYLDIFDN